MAGIGLFVAEESLSELDARAGMALLARLRQVLHAGDRRVGVGDQADIVCAMTVHACGRVQLLDGGTLAGKADALPWNDLM